jgi:hypothetical protein
MTTLSFKVGHTEEGCATVGDNRGFGNNQKRPNKNKKHSVVNETADSHGSLEKRSWVKQQISGHRIGKRSGQHGTKEN